MFYLPASFSLVIVFVFGLIIGSFLNVVIYRLHTGKSLNDRSHCLSCGRTLLWYELFPVISYIALYGRCRTCGAFIPLRYALVELLTALMFLLVYLHTKDIILTLLLFVLSAVLIIGLVYDLYHMIIPNEVVYWAVIIASLIVTYNFYKQGDYYLFGYAFLGGLLAFSFYASLWAISQGRWIGFGDAKLAIPLGMLLGGLKAFSMLVFSFWIGAILSLVILVYQRIRYSRSFMAKNGRYFTMKSEIPFAPFLVAAFVLVYFTEADVLSLTAYALDFVFKFF